MTSELNQLLRLARRAGDEILEVYTGEISVEEKADRSPLTEADRRANQVIVRELRSRWDFPILSEESRTVPFPERQEWAEFWLVDPLDGTKEFIRRNGEFTVNIARVRQGAPVLGVVYQPTTNTAYLAAEGHGAMKVIGDHTETLSTRGHYSEKEVVRVVASRSHGSPEVTEFVEGLRGEGKTVELTSAGSSLKLCLVAEGAADVYPRLGPTMEWDTAAAHCVVEQAGRQVLQWETREPLSYNKPDLLNPWFVVE